MPRLRLAAVPLLAGILPLSAGALGLGDIRLRSALNQPFEAEIPVTGDTADELQNLEVRLASAEVFERFGLDRPSFLSDLSFKVQATGTTGVVRVTSARPIAEPFVSLLMEVSWPAGRLLREYTVLLDPPAFAKQQPQVASEVAPAPGATAAGSVVQRAPAPEPVAPEPVSPQPLAPEPLAAEPAAIPPPPASSAPAPASGAPSAAEAAPGSFGPVRPRDTLWQIAEQTRPDASVSMNDMMMALYRANPEAFAGNINRLQAGAILRIPRVDEIAGLAGADATAEVRRQNEAWQGGAATRADAGPRLQLVPPEETPAPVPAAAPLAATRSPTPAVEPGAGIAASGSAGQVQALESELDESRRLLEMKDRELKALQDRVTTLEAEGAAAPPAPVAGPGEETALERLPDEADVPPATADGTLDRTAPAAPADDGMAAVAEEEAPLADPPPASNGQADPGLLGTLTGIVFNVWFLAAAAIALLAALFVFRRRTVTTFDESPAFRELRAPTLGGGAEAKPAREEGFIVEEQDDGADRTVIAPPPRPAPAREREQPLERTISADSGMELDQADVVAEADFHMAYGLYDQAADLLGKALRNDPSRKDLRVKLLEVYFIWENKGAFLKEAQALREQVPGSRDADWNKVLIMGKQLCPDEALFAGEASAAASDSLDFDVDTSSQPAAVDISFDELAGGAAAPAAGPDDSLDFDLGATGRGLGLSTEATGLSRTVDATTRNGADDFSTMETPTLESRTVMGPPTVETPTLEATGLGFNPGRDDRLAGEPAESTQELNLEELGLDLTGLDQAAGDLTGVTGVEALPDFELDDLLGANGIGDGEPAAGGSSDATAELKAAGPGLESTLDVPARLPGGSGDTAEHPALDDTAEQLGGDWDLGGGNGLDAAAQTGIVPEEIEPTAIVRGSRGRGPEGPTMTEVGTKLDLARAYIDMGDPDGARSILNEVLEEGDGSQQQEARRLLDELAT